MPICEKERSDEIPEAAKEIMREMGFLDPKRGNTDSKACGQNALAALLTIPLYNGYLRHFSKLRSSSRIALRINLSDMISFFVTS